jgi:hypothetical protein
MAAIGLLITRRTLRPETEAAFKIAIRWLSCGGLETTFIVFDKDLNSTNIKAAWNSDDSMSNVFAEIRLCISPQFGKDWHRYIL